MADPAHGEAAVPGHPPEQAGPADPGDVVISAEQIDALMAEKRQAARAEYGLSGNIPKLKEDLRRYKIEYAVYE